jgi:hypothetical protein
MLQTIAVERHRRVEICDAKQKVIELPKEWALGAHSESFLFQSLPTRPARQGVILIGKTCGFQLSGEQLDADSVRMRARPIVHKRGSPRLRLNPLNRTNGTPFNNEAPVQELDLTIMTASYQLDNMLHIVI